MNLQLYCIIGSVFGFLIALRILQDLHPNPDKNDKSELLLIGFLGMLVSVVFGALWPLILLCLLVGEGYAWNRR